MSSKKTKNFSTFDLNTDFLSWSFMMDKMEVKPSSSLASPHSGECQNFPEIKSQDRKFPD